MMRVWYKLAGWTAHRRTLTGTIGLVPTMGALHAGHAALVERCHKENDVAVATIFVNPSQFNDPKDLARYPQTLDQDLLLLENLGVDDVLVPTAAEMYPHGYHLRLEPDSSALILEGAHRPGFLQGVMTVVLKLLNLVQADRAYFGEKDYQQLLTVRAMAEEFFLQTEIVACPTVREPSGLAMSSRNALLTPEGRQKAAYLYHALTTCPDPRVSLEAHGFRVDYIEERWNRRLAAVFLEVIRLIDNVPMEKI